MEIDEVYDDLHVNTTMRVKMFDLDKKYYLVGLGDFIKSKETVFEAIEKYMKQINESVQVPL